MTLVVPVIWVCDVGLWRRVWEEEQEEEGVVWLLLASASQLSAMCASGTSSFWDEAQRVEPDVGTFYRRCVQSNTSTLFKKCGRWLLHATLHCTFSPCVNIELLTRRKRWSCVSASAVCVFPKTWDELRDDLSRVGPLSVRAKAHHSYSRNYLATGELVLAQLVPEPLRGNSNDLFTNPLRNPLLEDICHHLDIFLHHLWNRHIHSYSTVRCCTRSPHPLDDLFQILGRWLIDELWKHASRCAFREVIHTSLRNSWKVIHQHVVKNMPVLQFCETGNVKISLELISNRNFEMSSRSTGNSCRHCSEFEQNPAKKSGKLLKMVIIIVKSPMVVENKHGHRRFGKIFGYAWANTTARFLVLWKIKLCFRTSFKIIGCHLWVAQISIWCSGRDGWRGRESGVCSGGCAGGGGTGAVWRSSHHTAISPLQFVFGSIRTMVKLLGFSWISSVARIKTVPPTDCPLTNPWATSDHENHSGVERENIDHHAKTLIGNFCKTCACVDEDLIVFLLPNESIIVVHSSDVRRFWKFWFCPLFTSRGRCVPCPETWSLAIYIDCT